MFRLTVEPDGTVSQCETIQNDVKKPAFSKALVETIKELKFDPLLRRPQTVIYPLLFVPDTNGDNFDGANVRIGTEEPEHQQRGDSLWQTYEEPFLYSLRYPLVKTYSDKLLESGNTATLCLEVRIRADGTIDKINIINSTGTEKLNNWLKKQVQLISPAHQFSDSLKLHFDEGVIVRNFEYK